MHYISIWPAGATQPVVSTINDPQGAVVANAAIVPAGTLSGGVNVYNSGPAVADVNIDINGFFAAPTDLNQNTAIGANTMENNTTGFDNTAIGLEALLNNTTGHNNTATGTDALFGTTTGSGNIAIGNQAAANAPPGHNNSIYIGSLGAGSDSSGVIYLGTQGAQTGGTYIAGIYGAAAPSGTEVYVTSSGQLGTVLSSGRFKEQITDMGDTSSKLLQLHPVNFFYKPEYDDGSHLLQYGLIAEEVAQVFPEMVAYGNDGQILTVKYHLLTPMLLNESQKQHAEIQKLTGEAEKQNQHAQQQDKRLRGCRRGWLRWKPNWIYSNQASRPITDVVLFRSMLSTLLITRRTVA